ncbi:MAG: TetR/AcrR family transcriptional regulator [Sciscionella sp.]
MSEPTGGRVAQRRRTRKAIVDAATRLLAEGADPSVGDIADAAEVSRRTVYMYFPNLDQLILDATLGEMASSGYGAELDFDRYGDDVHARVDALINALLRMSEQALPLGRRLLRLTVDTAQANASSTPRRGYRRVTWIEEAVRPLRDRLSTEQFERLVSALAVIIGWEAMIVLRDTRNLSRRQEQRVTLWTAHAVLDAMLAGPDGDPT